MASDTKTPSVEQRLAALASGDAETQWYEAQDLARHGDRTAIVPLEQVLLTANGSFTREGAFVDHTEWAHLAAADALRALYLRHPPAPEDIARVREHLADPACPEDRYGLLAGTLGSAIGETVRPLTHHPDPLIRLRAHNVMGVVEKKRTNHALWLEDEQVRLAATRQDCYRGRLVADALERFSEEPSRAVRHGIFELWLRYRVRMAGGLYTREFERFLLDDDPELHLRAARHVLESKKTNRSPHWLWDQNKLGPSRDRLAELLGRTSDPAAQAVFTELLAVFDAALAPFRGS